MIVVEINGKQIEMKSQETILTRCRKLGIYIPTLCYHKDIGGQGICGICVVEINGEFKKACETLPKNGMVINTESPVLFAKRKAILEKIMETHPNDCLTCERAKGDCDLQNACFEHNVINRQTVVRDRYPIDYSSSGMVRDMNKCIKCEKCVVICRDKQKIDVYEVVEREGEKEIIIRGDIPLNESKCISCGQCVKVCPVGALTEKSNVKKLNQMLKNKSKHLVIQFAPAVVHTIGEEFLLPVGANKIAKIVGACRKLGFDKVFPTEYSADVTIIEEGGELIHRILDGAGKLPMFTSCCPGWVNFLEKNYPEYIDNLSSCKSPQQMLGALAKSYYPTVSGIPKEEIYVVSVMPCTAKHGEAARPEMEEHGLRDVDMVITTRELAKLIRINGINFGELPNEILYDAFMGTGSSAGRIFGTSGGVMEAALRTVTHKLEDGKIKRLDRKLDYKGVRGFNDVKEAIVYLGEREIKMAVVNGVGSAKKVMEALKKGEIHYDFIEVMACFGGCIAGGGSPIPDNLNVKEERMKGMYAADSESKLRTSHENPAIEKLYKDYLKEPGGHKSHHLLHTTYRDRSKK